MTREIGVLLGRIVMNMGGNAAVCAARRGVTECSARIGPQSARLSSNLGTQSD